MDDYRLALKFIFSSMGLSLILILFLVMLVSNSESGDASSIATEYFQIPFNENIRYTITSNFGGRTDPINGGDAYHTGIDLSAPAGTEILASANGIVEEVGYSADGLGNYVYVKHEFNGIVYYSAYGHMLDDSIVVSKDQPVVAGDKIGVIGTTGRSTGIHLHFMLMSPIISFNKQYLVDPSTIVDGFKKGI